MKYCGQKNKTSNKIRGEHTYLNCRIFLFNTDKRHVIVYLLFIYNRGLMSYFFLIKIALMIYVSTLFFTNSSQIMK